MLKTSCTSASASVNTGRDGDGASKDSTNSRNEIGLRKGIILLILTAVLFLVTALLYKLGLEPGRWLAENALVAVALSIILLSLILGMSLELSRKSTCVGYKKISVEIWMQVFCYISACLGTSLLVIGASIAHDCPEVTTLVCKEFDRSLYLPMDVSIIALLTPFLLCRYLQLEWQPMKLLCSAGQIVTALGFIVAIILSDSYASFVLLFFMVVLKDYTMLPCSSSSDPGKIAGMSLKNEDNTTTADESRLSKSWFRRPYRNQYQRIGGEVDRTNEGDFIQIVISHLSHDFMSPLQVLEMGMDTLRHIFVQKLQSEEGAITSSADECKQVIGLLDGMITTLTMCAVNIDRIVDLSKHVGGLQLTPNNSNFRVKDSLTKMVRYVRDTFSHGEIVVKDLTEGQYDLLAYTDKRWFESNVFCMLSNAVKFSTLPETVPILVQMNVEDVLDYEHQVHVKMLRMEIHDSGEYVNEEERAALFDFPDEEARKRHGGSGLGLFALASRVNALKGQYGSYAKSAKQYPSMILSACSRDSNEYDSIRNRQCEYFGSVFWFMIPFRQEDVLLLQEASTGTTGKRPTKSMISKSKVVPSTIHNPNANNGSNRICAGSSKSSKKGSFSIRSDNHNSGRLSGKSAVSLAPLKTISRSFHEVQMKLDASYDEINKNDEAPTAIDSDRKDCKHSDRVNRLRTPVRSGMELGAPRPHTVSGSPFNFEDTDTFEDCERKLLNAELQQSLLTDAKRSMQSFSSANTASPMSMTDFNTTIALTLPGSVSSRQMNERPASYRQRTPNKNPKQVHGRSVYYEKVDSEHTSAGNPNTGRAGSVTTSGKMSARTTSRRPSGMNFKPMDICTENSGHDSIYSTKSVESEVKVDLDLVLQSSRQTPVLLEGTNEETSEELFVESPHDADTSEAYSSPERSRKALDRVRDMPSFVSGTSSFSASGGLTQLHGSHFDLGGKRMSDSLNRRESMRLSSHLNETRLSMRLSGVYAGRDSASNASTGAPGGPNGNERGSVGGTVTVAAIAEVGEQTNESSNASDMPPLSMQENTTGGTNSGINVLESDMSARNLFIQTPSRRHSRVHKSSFSVLVVDDSTPILKITKISLERAGHTVDQAFNGRIALDKMKSNFYDVVLMDIQMPIMGGIEAVTRYREYERDQVSRSAASFRQQFRRQLLIIGMSANGDSSVMEEAIRCGMDAFVSKPFSLEAMMKVIDAHSNRRGSQPVSPVGPNSAVSATSDAGNGSRLSCSR